MMMMLIDPQKGAYLISLECHILLVLAVARGGLRHALKRVHDESTRGRDCEGEGQEWRQDAEVENGDVAGRCVNEQVLREK